MKLEEKVKNQLEFLYTMLDKYQILNQKTKCKYGYRQQAIEIEIEILEQILDESDINTSWEYCYQEDSKEVKK